MSFSVKAGTSPSQNPSAPPAHSFNHSHVSPSLIPSANSSGTGFRGGNAPQHSNPPPFSLNGGDADTGVVPSSKRVGTDPTKYKTTICRNWEQTGSCSFRGCTFAHGVDDLRPPLRPNTSPPLGPQVTQPSPSQTPPMFPQTLPPTTTNSSVKLEQILEMLVAEVSRERDLVLVHVEANKTLEGMLRREQTLHQETMSRVEALQNQASELARQVAERNSEILRLVELSSHSLTTEQRRHAESLASWHFGGSDFHLPKAPSASQAVHADAADSSLGSSAASGVPSARRQPMSTPPLKSIDDSTVSQNSSKGNNVSAPAWVPPGQQQPPIANKSTAAYADHHQQQQDSSSPTESKIRDLLEALRK